MAAQAVDVFSSTRTVDTISHGALVPSGNERVADTKDGGCSFRASCEVPQMVGLLDDAHRFSSRDYLCYLRRLYQFRVFGTNTRISLSLSFFELEQHSRQGWSLMSVSL
jgi:hypothetical protein